MLKMTVVLAFLTGLVCAQACGVKGPPLPPVADNPQKTDPEPRSYPSPSVTPSR